MNPDKSTVTDKLEQILRRRTQYHLSVLTLVVAFWSSVFFVGSEPWFVPLCIFMFILLIVLQYPIFNVKCPRCEGKFFIHRMLTKPFSSSCPHCGLSK